MKQKFSKFSFVHVCKKMPKEMSHFESDFDAIVEGTYSQLYGGKDINSYSLYMLEKGKIIDNIAWYYEKQLTLLSEQNKDKAEQMIEDYNFQNEEEY